MRSALSICLHSSFPTAIYWGRELRLLYNDAWAPIPAERHPWALGQPAAAVWSDIWHVVGPQFARVMETGEGFSTYDQMLPMVRNGSPRETYWNYSFTPIRGEDGAVVGIFNQGNETTSVVLARREVQAEVDRLAGMFAQAPGAIAVLRGPSHRFELVNAAYEALVGRTALVGKTVGEALPEVAAQGFVDWLDRVLETGQPHVGRGVEVTIVRGAAPERLLLDFVYQPLFDAGGACNGIFVQATDVTEAAEATAALKESDEFSRSVVEASDDCIKVLDLDGRLRFINESGRRLMEIDESAAVEGKLWRDLWPDESRTHVANAMRAALRGEAGRFSAFCPTRKGRPKWWDVVVTPVIGADGEPVRLVSISRDVTDQRRAAETRQLLLREMDHRVKNLFAIATGMVTMTARSSATAAEMEAALKGRLAALAKAHELIHADISGEDLHTYEASVKHLLEAIVAPHLPDDDGRLVLEGPVVRLGPRSVTPLALILHELATNAAKYGAFSSPRGRLSVRWHLAGDRLRLIWKEDAASAVAPPRTTGFGSRLARTASAQLGGSIVLDWPPDGVRIALDLPVERLSH